MVEHPNATLPFCQENLHDDGEPFSPAYNSFLYAVQPHIIQVCLAVCKKVAKAMCWGCKMNWAASQLEPLMTTISLASLQPGLKQPFCLGMKD